MMMDWTDWRSTSCTSRLVCTLGHTSPAPLSCTGGCGGRGSTADEECCDTVETLADEEPGDILEQLLEENYKDV